MSDGAESRLAADGEDAALAEMLRRVRAIDPEADAGAVRRYAREIAEADAVLQSLALDPGDDPLPATFSPAWNHVSKPHDPNGR